MGEQIDMSGAVWVNNVPIYWDATAPGGIVKHLTPFTQGTIRVALEELNARLFKSGGYTEADFFGYRHLAPETLAWFIAEGERFTRPIIKSAALSRSAKKPITGEDAGKRFWAARQRGLYSDHRPVTLTVRDDGLIYVEAHPHD